MAGQFTWNVNTREVRAVIPKDAKRIEKALAIYMVGAVKRYTPVDTGRLRDSIDTEDTGHGWEVFTEVPYAPYVEEGTAYAAPAAMFRRGAEETASQFDEIAAGAVGQSSSAGGGGFGGFIQRTLARIFGR